MDTIQRRANFPFYLMGLLAFGVFIIISIFLIEPATLSNQNLSQMSFEVSSRIKILFNLIRDSGGELFGSAILGILIALNFSRSARTKGQAQRLGIRSLWITILIVGSAIMVISSFSLLNGTNSQSDVYQAWNLGIAIFLSDVAVEVIGALFAYLIIDGILSTRGKEERANKLTIGQTSWIAHRNSPNQNNIE